MLALVLTTFSTNVHAITGNVTMTSYDPVSTGSIMWYNGSYPREYHNSNFTVEINGVSYDGLCVDPGYKFGLNQAVAMDCQQLSGDQFKPLLYLHNHRDEIQGSIGREGFNLATRFVAFSMGLNRQPPLDVGVAIAGFASDAGANLANYQSVLGKYFSGSMVGPAAEWAHKAFTEADGDDRGDNNIDQQDITYTFDQNQGSCGNFRITVHARKKLENVSFKCLENTCRVVGGSSAINGARDENGYYTGYVTIALNNTTQCDAQWKVQMQYKGDVGTSDVFMCTKGGTQLQYIMAIAGDSSMATLDMQGDYPDGCRPNNCGCCTPSIDPDQYPEKDINNCCYLGTESNVREWDLPDLFCSSVEGGRTAAQLMRTRCGVDDAYKLKANEVTLNEFCVMYCTERARVLTPYASKGSSGRYFQMKEQHINDPDVFGAGIFDTTAPYLKQYRRCRLVVDYPTWETKYIAAIRQEISNYNEYQKQASLNEMTSKYEYETIDMGVVNYTGYCYTYSCWQEYDPYWDYYYPYCSSPTQYGNSKSADTPYLQYKLWTVTPSSVSDYTTGWGNYTQYNKYYYQVILDEANAQQHIKYQMLDDPGNKYHTSTYKTMLDQKDADYIQEQESTAYSNANSVYCPSSTSSGGVDYYYYTSVSRSGNRIQDYPKEYFPEYPNRVKSAMDAALRGYQGAVSTANSLEEKLTFCDKYFERITDADAERMYDVSKLSLKFYYEQIYKADDGSRQIDETYVPFVGYFEGKKPCQLRAYNYNTFTENEHDIEPNQYSEDYGSGTADGDGFKAMSLNYVNADGAFRSFVTYTYPADKLITTDGVFKAACAWVDDIENNYYTLIPGGYVETSAKVENYIIHNREYRVYLNTYEGTFETLWELTGIGHKGHLDRAFKDSVTCGGESPENNHHIAAPGETDDPEATFTCGLKIRNRLIRIGECLPPGEKSDVQINPDECDDDPDPILFNFKTVDSANTFPAGTTTDDGTEYAKNWTRGNGPLIRQTIESTGAQDSTYSPKNLTYSFVLSSNNITLIKEYNEKAVPFGGYKDFTLECSCVRDRSARNCNECRSKFLTNLAQNKIGVSGVMTPVASDVKNWAGTKSIEEVRRTNNWRPAPNLDGYEPEIDPDDELDWGFRDHEDHEVVWY